VRALQLQILHLQAVGAAYPISTFIREIESQLGWIAQLPWPAGIIDQQMFVSLRLMPAIRRLRLLDSAGKLHARSEDLRVMPPVLRFRRPGATDAFPDDIGTDCSQDPKFMVAVAKKVYYGPVYFRGETEPFMTLAVAGTRRDPLVSIAEVSLKSIWDVVSRIKVGERGQAYVVDANGRLIAHPDISLVLRITDMTQAARSAGSYPGAEPLRETRDISGRSVLAAYAPVTPLGWLVFVELLVEEA
jgi:Cache domain